MSEANPDRGEHQLVLAAQRYRLRPSHQAIVAIERKAERSLLELVRLGNAGGLSLERLGIIAAELIRAGAEKGDTMTQAVSAERIGELIFDEGVHKAMAALTLCLLDAASGGRTASGEAKAPAAPTTEDAGAA